MDCICRDLLSFVSLQESILKTLQDTVEAEELKSSQKLHSYETQLDSVNRSACCMLTVS